MLAYGNYDTKSGNGPDGSARYTRLNVTSPMKQSVG